jgi:hypothetical protein
MDGTIDLLLYQEVIYRFNIFVFASVRRADDRANPYCVLVDQVDGFLGIDHESLSRAEDILLFDVEVS